MSAVDSPAAATHRGILRTVLLLLVFIVVIVGGFVYTMVKPKVLSPEALRANNTFVFDRPRDIGDFALLDDNGKPFVPMELKGRWSLLFFGFTFCPDVCPTTMALLNKFEAKLKPEYRRDTQVIMVSVDPARDDAAKLHQYVAYFNPQFRGVTGEFLSIQKFATSLNAPFSKVPGGGDNYQIAHSGSVAIVDTNGHYIGFFKEPLDLDKMVLSYESIRLSRR
jgi:protein SCO1/2